MSEQPKVGQRVWCNICKRKVTLFKRIGDKFTASCCPHSPDLEFEHIGPARAQQVLSRKNRS